MSGSRPSFRATAAQRLAEDGGALPPAIEELLSDTRRIAVRMLPVRLVQLHAARRDATVEGAGLEPLIASVRDLGVLEPILVRPVDAGGFEVVAGERRLRAARLAGLDAIPAVVRDMDEATATTLVSARASAERHPNPERPVEALQQPRPSNRPSTNGTYMPPAVVARREPRVISGPGIPGPTELQRGLEQQRPGDEERAVAGDEGTRGRRFRIGPFPFRRRERGDSGEHR